MKCHCCGGDLVQVASLDNRNQGGELLFRYACRDCQQIYEAWYRPVTFYTLPLKRSDEDEAILVRLCAACGRLYPDGETHQCIGRAG